MSATSDLPVEQTLVCEWEYEGVRCTCPAIYRTHFYMLICREHGSLLMFNNGNEYLVDLQDRQGNWLGAAGAQKQGSDRDTATQQNLSGRPKALRAEIAPRLPEKAGQQADMERGNKLPESRPARSSLSNHEKGQP